MKEETKKLWRQTRLQLWPETYWLISLPHERLQYAAEAVAASAQHFAALVIERDEVSLTLCESIWRQHAHEIKCTARAGPYRVITFDLNIELSVSGYLLPAAARLAEAGISIVPQCAFLKDHLLLKAEDAARAMSVLQQLITECQAG